VGDFVDVDDSQLELRKLQFLSGDKRMKEVFDAGESIHRDTARLLYGNYSDAQYRSSKNTNFCIVYGGGIPRIADTAGVSMAEAARIQRTWSEGYPEAWGWLKRTADAAVRGEKIETVGGRKMVIHWDQEGEDGVRKRAVNYPIQTSAGETLRTQMLLAWCPAMVCQIHDQLLFDRNVGSLPWTSKQLEEMLEWVGPVHTPVVAKEYTRWGT
jgi:DNA polymerase-1